MSRLEDRGPVGAATPDQPIKLSDETAETLGLELATVERHEWHPVLEAMGQVAAQQHRTAIVSYALPARVVEVYVHQEDWWEEGEKVITLESHEIGAAKSEFFKAVAACELAKVTLEKQKRLVAEGIGARKNLLQAEGEYRLAEANREAAEKTLHVLGFTEEEVADAVATHLIGATIDLFAPLTGRAVEV